MPSYDLLIYRDFDDTVHDEPPAIGVDASTWFGQPFEGLYVTAVGPGIHSGRLTVVLSSEHRPDRQQAIKEFFA
jgi:hypothetical protein